MDIELNPKLLDVVEFEESSQGARLKRKGTVVQIFREPPSAVLIEMAGSQGVPLAFVTRKIEEVKMAWTPAETKGEEVRIPEAQQLFEKGILFLQNGAMARAKDYFSRAFALDPKLAGSLMNATHPLAEKGAFEAAMLLYGLILELLPQYQLARENLSITHVNRGVELARRGVIDRAIEDFTSALMLGPTQRVVELVKRNLVAGYTQLGIRHTEIKQYHEATNYFVMAFELSPYDVTRKNLALALVAASAAKTESGAQLPEKDFFRQPMLMGLTISECLNAYGATLANLGRLTEARLALEAAVETDAKNEMAKKNLARLVKKEPLPALIPGLTQLEGQEIPLRAGRD